MRKVAAAALALPILALVYLTTVLLRAWRAATARPLPRAIALVALIVATAAAAGLQSRPLPATAKPPSTPAVVPAAAFRSEVRAGTGPTDVVTMTFPAPMSEASVAASIVVRPADPVALGWDPTRTVLTIAPAGEWGAGVLHTITVPAGALEASGAPLLAPIRASFLTRGPATATIVATDVTGGAAAPTTGFVVTFDSAVRAASVGLRIEPSVDGVLERDPDAPASNPVFVFEPSVPLAAGTTYRVSLAPEVANAYGDVVSAVPLVVTTAARPAVVRFRPSDGTKDVDWKQALSVRFSQSMDRASTQAAWSATQGGATVDGTFSWAEDDRVLVFAPKSALGYAQTVTMTVRETASSRAGVALGSPASATFTTAAKPVVKTTTPPPPPSGGGSAGSSTWTAVEAYYLTLMNCTRTGGWVSSTGSCSGAGTRAVAPLWQDQGISAYVTRPYAKKLVIDNVCSHFYGSTPAERLAAAGYTSYIWAENIGCGGGDPYAAVLADHLFFQGEASTNGGHYRNLMDAKYDRCGIGVWAYAGRVRLVIDFYHPL